MNERGSGAIQGRVGGAMKGRWVKPGSKLHVLDN